MPVSTANKSHPFYLKATIILLGLVLFFYILDALTSVLVPFAFAALLSILLNPLANRLGRKMPRALAIAFTLLAATIVVAGLIYFLSSQVAMFSESLPQIKQKISTLLTDAQSWIQSELGADIKKQVDGIKSGLSGGGNTDMITSTLGGALGLLGALLLLPVYVFLLLYYKPLILDFLFHVFSEKHSMRVAEILGQTKSAIQSFMVGLMIEMVIVCTLNSVALLIIGVPNAIVIGVIGGILNLLPYLGGIIAVGLAVLMSLVSSESFSPILAIIGSYLFIQFIDNNFLVPRIVSSKVKINALISILVVLLGGLLWDLSGMFLSIPFIAILKIIFDRIEELKPWGKLLGDDVPSEHMGVAWQKRWSRIVKRRETAKEKKT